MERMLEASEARTPERQKKPLVSRAMEKINVFRKGTANESEARQALAANAENSIALELPEETDDVAAAEINDILGGDNEATQQLLKDGFEAELVTAVGELSTENADLATQIALEITAAEEQLEQRAEKEPKDSLELTEEGKKWASEQFAAIANRIPAPGAPGYADALQRELKAAVENGWRGPIDGVDALYGEVIQTGMSHVVFPDGSLGSRAAAIFLEQGSTVKRLDDLWKRSLSRTSEISYVSTFKKEALTGDVIAHALEVGNEDVIELIDKCSSLIKTDQLTPRLAVEMVGNGLAGQLVRRREQLNQPPLGKDIAFTAVDKFGPGALQGNTEKFVGLDELSATEIEHIHSSYYEHRQNFADLRILDHYGIHDEETVRVTKIYESLREMRPELATDNPALNGRFLSDDIIKTLGMDTVGTVLDYRSGASEAVVHAAGEGRLSELKQWLDTAQKASESYPADLLTHNAITSFENTAELAVALQGKSLSDTDKHHLVSVLLSGNEFGITSTEELKNYAAIRREKAKEKLEGSKNFYQTREALAEGLFGMPSSELKGLYGECFPTAVEKSEKLNMTLTAVKGMQATELAMYAKRYNLDDADLMTLKRLTPFLQDAFAPRKSGSEAADSTLRMRYEHLLNATSEQGYDVLAIREKARESLNKTYDTVLFKDDGVDRRGLAHTQVSGLEGGEIPVSVLGGANFKFLIHKIHNFDPHNDGIASKLAESPALWKTGEGSSTISTSLISEEKIDFVGSTSTDGALRPINNTYYGFSELGDNSVMMMGPGDIYTTHGTGELTPKSERNTAAFMTPYELQRATPAGKYNEVVLNRKNGNTRLTPSTIICFGSHEDAINDQSKRAAEYFGVPITLIDRRAYSAQNY